MTFICVLLCSHRQGVHIHMKQQITTLIFRFLHWRHVGRSQSTEFNPSNAELNPICYQLALLGAHHILHVSRVRVNILLAL